jgi:aminoglycoside 6'-N-acetyltransferase I
MKILNLLKDDSEKILQTAVLLHESFDAWPTIDLATNEVKESLDEDCISRILLNTDGEVIGWIGGKSQYNGNVWELHPLVIHRSYRNRGLGKL